MLAVTDLHAGYGGTRVLHGITLDLAAGETVCLIGANGVGKTTLMRCIAGLLHPTSGGIRIDQSDVAARSAAARVSRGLALVPEGRHVFGPLTVLENLRMGAFLRLFPRRDRAVGSDLDRIFALFPRLSERRNQSAAMLSGGEQQMLAIGRALMSRPRLLLLDEPSMGLAPLVVRDIFAAIAELGQQGMAILVAEQNARVALRTAARGYVISEGVIVRSATSQALAEDDVVRAAYLGV